ncbi:PREDICTED: uncharacterized protein LOC105454751 isoform X2 [Wasmannia auropunctata]|uniref:uncharacterized protein LOC105454751 isoform X2 n=1 Tax=Wasmannia auropunctata TaxID=64793 RepID=UPI0005F037D8|nr:PREDICTED: uncharacterized protein LOC105454751 isoform X2 [Wasmannia auropunctata]
MSSCENFEMVRFSRVLFYFETFGTLQRCEENNGEKKTLARNGFLATLSTTWIAWIACFHAVLLLYADDASTNKSTEFSSSFMRVS